MSDLHLSGKAAIVTGGSKGIGFSIAEKLLSAGASVAICARNEAEVHAAAAALEGRGGRVVGLSCDVRSHEDVRDLISATVNRFGGLDILINNAGVGGFAPIDQLSVDDWHRILQTNLSGVFYACREAIPHLRERGGGWIINIGSLAGKNAFAGGSAYNASKFGLVGFSEAMMLDVRHQGIRVSCIMPGSVATHFSGTPDPSSAWKLQPEDVAQMVTDLLAFESRALPSLVEMRPSQPPRK
jgi:3-oxoacyl-[acyl-carrier protein] reductase